MKGWRGMKGSLVRIVSYASGNRCTHKLLLGLTREEADNLARKINAEIEWAEAQRDLRIAVDQKKQGPLSRPQAKPVIRR